MDGFETTLRALQERRPGLPASLLRRLLRAYGTRVEMLLGDAQSLADLGRNFGADLTEAEITYLVHHEFATGAQDILWRRSKLGLRLTPEQAAEVEACVRACLPAPERVG